jgi:hypothetical protein
VNTVQQDAFSTSLYLVTLLLRKAKPPGEHVKQYPKYLDWLRYVCALLLYFYGMSKLTGHQLTVPPEIAQKPVNLLSGYWLTWYYYSYSHAYKDILGLTQIAGASLLLFRKTALIAAAMMVPVMANIVLINIFYAIAVGAELTATFILFSMMLLMWNQRVELLAVFWGGQAGEPVAARKFHWMMRALVLLVVLVQVIVGTLLYH